MIDPFPDHASNNQVRVSQPSAARVRKDHRALRVRVASCVRPDPILDRFWWPIAAATGRGSPLFQAD
jgi:hypothetical protein